MEELATFIQKRKRTQQQIDDVWKDCERRVERGECEVKQAGYKAKLNLSYLRICVLSF